MSTKEKSKILVIGGGSWATALSKVISENTQQLMWWMRNEDSISHLEKFAHNPKYLQSASFEMNHIELSSDLKALIAKADVLIVAIPSAFIHDTLKDIPKELFKGKKGA